MRPRALQGSVFSRHTSHAGLHRCSAQSCSPTRQHAAYTCGMRATWPASACIDISESLSGLSSSRGPAFAEVALGTAGVGVRQGCPLRPTLVGIFFHSLDTQLQAESAAAGVEHSALAVVQECQACSMLMTLRCYHPRRRGCSSYWTPCSRSASPTGLQSASQRPRWWCLVGATNSASGIWGAIALA